MEGVYALFDAARRTSLTMEGVYALWLAASESEFGIHFVSGSTVTRSLVLMSRTDFENYKWSFCHSAILKVGSRHQNEACGNR